MYGMAMMMPISTRTKSKKIKRVILRKTSNNNKGVADSIPDLSIPNLVLDCTKIRQYQEKTKQNKTTKIINNNR